MAPDRSSFRIASDLAKPKALVGPSEDLVLTLNPRYESTGEENPATSYRCNNHHHIER